MKYVNTNIEIPDLFYETTSYIGYLLTGLSLEHSRADFCFIRRSCIEILKGSGITQENYRKFHRGTAWSILTEVCWAAINNYYCANFSQKSIR